jgi:hypothetical protein
VIDEPTPTVPEPAGPTLFERIAKVCYEADRAWSQASGQLMFDGLAPSAAPPWESAGDSSRSSMVEAVKLALAGATTEAFAKLGVAAAEPGSYEQLESQKRKADLFAAIVTALGCGKERWDVKTLTDPEASRVDLTPQLATVAYLVNLPAPAQPTSREPAECLVYELKGTITMAKMETDSDYHMVLDDGRGNTMIIEAPSLGCCSGSRVADQIAAVRAAVEAHFPPVAQGALSALGQPITVTASVPVTVTGVAFFDRLHHQTGVALNGIELHPLLSFNPGGPA